MFYVVGPFRFEGSRSERTYIVGTHSTGEDDARGHFYLELPLPGAPRMYMQQYVFTTGSIISGLFLCFDASQVGGGLPVCRRDLVLVLQENRCRILARVNNRFVGRSSSPPPPPPSLDSTFWRICYHTSGRIMRCTLRLLKAKIPVYIRSTSYRRKNTRKYIKAVSTVLLMPWSTRTPYVDAGSANQHRYAVPGR